jgi:hypothetical protein
MPITRKITDLRAASSHCFPAVEYSSPEQALMVCLPSSCPSVYPHLSARLKLDRFERISVLGTTTKICQETPNLIKIGQKCRTLYVKAQVRENCEQQYEIFGS